MEESDHLDDKVDENSQSNISEKETEKIRGASIEDMPQTMADVEEAKKKFNSGDMTVNGNQADNLITIQNAVINGGISSASYNVREVLLNSHSIDKEYNLSIPEQFAEFGETVRGGEHFAIAIILCVFEYVEMDDLQGLKSKLLAELPKVTDETGTEKGPYQNAYLSIDNLLKSINGEIVVLDSGERCVRLGVSRSSAMKNLWQQFPEMRSHIASWLTEVAVSFEYRTNFDTFQITAAFVNILKLDFTAGSVHILSRLYSSKNHYWLLGFIALELYKDSEYCHQILPLIFEWLDSGSSWKWKSAVYVYANSKNDDSKNFGEKVRKVLMRQYNYFEYTGKNNKDYHFLGIMLMSSGRLRTLISSTLGDRVNSTSNSNKKRLNGLCYLVMIQYGYYLVSPQNTDLPLVACDDKKQLEKLLPVLEVVLLRNDIRLMFFNTLQSYLREISRYGIEKKTINHLKAFFQFISQRDKRFCDDIILFLKKCDCKLAEEIVDHLVNVLPADFSRALQILKLT